MEKSLVTILAVSVVSKKMFVLLVFISVQYPRCLLEADNKDEEILRKDECRRKIT